MVDSTNLASPFTPSVYPSILRAKYTMGTPSYLRLVHAPTAHTPIDWSRVPKESKSFLRHWTYKDDDRPKTVAELAKMFDDRKFFGYFDTDLCTFIMDISEFGLQAAPDQAMRVGPRFYMEYCEQVWFLLFTPGSRDCIVGHSDDIIREEDEEEEEEEEEDEEVRLEEGVVKGMAHLGCSDDVVMKTDEEDEEVRLEGDVVSGMAHLGCSDDVVMKADEEDEEDMWERWAAEEVALAQKFDVRLEQDILRGMAQSLNSTKKLGGWDAHTVQTLLHLWL